ncbi:hypothetical protein SHIRM173S_12322 [Streptomyces hirsutus]
MLGRIVEVVSGSLLHVFFAERILGQLGLTDAGFHVTGEQAARLAELSGVADGSGGGAACGGEPVAGRPLHGRPRFLSGSGGLVASARDMHRVRNSCGRGASWTAAGGSAPGRGADDAQPAFRWRRSARHAAAVRPTASPAARGSASVSASRSSSTRRVRGP